MVTLAVRTVTAKEVGIATISEPFCGGWRKKRSPVIRQGFNPAQADKYQEELSLRRLIASATGGGEKIALAIGDKIKHKAPATAPSGVLWSAGAKQEPCVEPVRRRSAGT